MRAADWRQGVAVPGVAHGIIATAFAIVAAFVGLKGIQYVARVATYLPLIPVVVLLILLVNTWGGLAASTPEVIAAKPPSSLQSARPEKADLASSQPDR